MKEIPKHTGIIATPRLLRAWVRLNSLASSRSFTILAIAFGVSFVAGSFVLGLDVDREGVGHRIAETARGYGLDFLNVLYLTPLPGTRLWNAMEEAGGLTATDFPDDWQFYTLNHPVIRHGHLSPGQIRDEMRACTEEFYSWRGVFSRVLRNVWRRCEPRLTLAGNLSFRVNGRASREPGAELDPILVDAGKHVEVGGDARALRTRPASAGPANSLLDQSSARSS